MAGQASAFVNHKGIVLWLMAVTVAFQVFSHLKMWRALRQQESIEDEWCSAASVTSPRCAEAQLFRSWQHAAKAAAAAASAASPGRRPGQIENAVEDMTTASPGVVVPNDFEEVPSVLLSAVFAAGFPSSTLHPSVTAAGEKSAASLPASVAANDGAHGETTWSPMTAWARGLADLQRSFEQRARELKRAHEAPTLSEQLDEQAERITRSLESSGETAWARGLQNLQRSLEERKAQLPSQRAKPSEVSLMDKINAVHRELCEDPQRRGRQDCVEFLAALAASQEASADARLVERRAAAMLAETKAGSSAKALEEHQATLRTELARIAEERATWQRDFDAKVQRTYAQLCADRGGVWCTTQSPSASAGDVASASLPRGAKAEWRANITQEAKRRAAALDAKLLQLAEDRRAWERALLEHYGLSAPGHEAVAEEATVTPEPAEQAGASSTLAAVWVGVPNLRWSAVASWKSAGTRLRGVHHGVHVEVNRSELAPARWVGALPKVACITVLPLHHSAKSQVKYVVDSFSKQSYEGPKQLVIVYHHEDEEAVEVVKMYADGSYVKAVAAQGPREDFPSATAFRFGAWSADADAIAQWDFDEWQHPQRLALQLRALAFASRPASLLRPPSRPADPAPRLWEGSLLGEVAWMREHWHPALEAQHAVLEGAEAHNVVALDMSGPARHGGAAAARFYELRSNVDRTFEGLVAHIEPPARPATK
eukprot:CAMPEP_0170223388 /NCGR_PEP_ID=MMETSP0116_2-20130129/11393_1 /TAXON_ID=400756 /ORGANISM="Durinskia baltica, Strain CSIRO CS-38" /LENGTH=714 /DNA_ID=CAMNT_0010474089 /DNA_START=107 /DNA_END=2251 /DNA_ORIENTATION=+